MSSWTLFWVLFSVEVYEIFMLHGSNKFKPHNIWAMLIIFIWMLNAFICWVENQSDQYGTQSLGFGGFWGLLVSGLMFSIVCCCKNKPPFYLARKAENPLLFCGAYSELFSRFDSKPNAVGKSSQLGKISDPLLWKNKCGESCKPWKMSD